MYFLCSLKKNLFLVMIVFIAIMSAAGAVKGDANNDSQVNIIDALVIAQYSVGLSVSIDLSAADVDCNSSVNIIDALVVAQYSVGSMVNFPCGTATPTATQTATPTPTTGTVSKVFPYSPYKYPYGNASVSQNQTSDNSFVKSEWQSFKSSYVTSNGAGGNLRIVRPQDSNDTVSEGIGYGMLLAVYMDDQNTFNGLWAYAKKYLDAQGLMNWQIDSSGNVIGKNAATDGDEDMALALIFADKKWGGNNYNADAKNLINSIYNYEVEAGTYVLKPGDVWGGSACTNISYYCPAAYKIFASYTGNNNWNQVIDKCYQVISLARNSNTGLVPDWCTASGGSTDTVTWDQYKNDYYYDAVRAPLRLSWDYLWFGDSRAAENCNKMTAFWANKGATNIMAGYTLSGNPIGNYKDGGFVGVTGACAMASINISFATAMLDQVKTVKSNQYFQDCLRMLSLLVVTGNFPNLSAL